MSEEEFVQLFWFIFGVTSICLILVVGGYLIDHLERWDYRKFVKHQKARARWAEMMDHDRT